MKFQITSLFLLSFVLTINAIKVSPEDVYPADSFLKEYCSHNKDEHCANLAAYLDFMQQFLAQYYVSNEMGQSYNYVKGVAHESLDNILSKSNLSKEEKEKEVAYYLAAVYFFTHGQDLLMKKMQSNELKENNDE